MRLYSGADPDSSLLPRSQADRLVADDEPPSADDSSGECGYNPGDFVDAEEEKEDAKLGVVTRFRKKADQLGYRLAKSDPAPACDELEYDLLNPDELDDFWDPRRSTRGALLRRSDALRATQGPR